MAKKKTRKKAKKRKTMSKKPRGITNINKTAAKRLKTKTGYAMVFGTKASPTIGRKRFKSRKMAEKEFLKRI